MNDQHETTAGSELYEELRTAGRILGAIVFEATAMHPDAYFAAVRTLDEAALATEDATMLGKWGDRPAVLPILSIIGEAAAEMLIDLPDLIRRDAGLEERGPGSIWTPREKSD